MKKWFFMEIFVYLFEIVFTVFFGKAFLPLFGYFFVLLTSRKILQPKTQFLFCFLSGLLYDFCITTTPFMNTLLFPLFFFLQKKIDTYFPKNKLTFLLLFLFEIIAYRTFTCFILLLIQYTSFSIISYIQSILASLLFNFLFVVLFSVFVLREKRNTL